MNKIKLSHPNKIINAEIPLNGSKSISNRVLLIRALCEGTFNIDNLSTSDDTDTLEKLLSEEAKEYNTGHAGTTFRFLTAYLAFKEGTQYLTGSDRMKQRPIKALVEALNDIGANIEYEKEEGYPPLIIHSPKVKLNNEVKIKSNISSQYISALLMLAPTLSNGLKITLEGELVSKPYLLMTLSIMKYFGIEYKFEQNIIEVKEQKYLARDYFVESDWSAASYYFSIAAIADQAEIKLTKLFKDSLQGDSEIVRIAEKFGVAAEFKDNEVIIKKRKNFSNPQLVEYNFIEQPDIAQTVFTMCAATDTQGLFTGLQTLYIKETDRLQAFKNELSKVGVSLTKLPPKFSKNSKNEYFLLEGKIEVTNIPTFDTYHDHRMAMALAPLALKNEIIINDFEVVSKSYPDFWNHLKLCNFDIVIQ
jgi:3-phosphoshikimate 1-carboxyvinyltransferase